ncbi:MAG: hypothetical protein K9J21_10485 [Bacteroidales bacterium]|nr:hypothetical protein [Bacteroidales bacterium]
MAQFPKMKQISGLLNAIGAKADKVDVVKKTNNLSDLQSASAARSNLGVYSSSEVDALLTGASQSRSLPTLNDAEALTDLVDFERIHVQDDLDGKWAIYLVVDAVDGTWANATIEKIADQDVFENAMSASAVKQSYESNPDTNAFSDSEQAKLGHISVTQPVDLDGLEATANDAASDASQALTDASNAQTTANNAQNAASNAQNAADAAQATADTKMDSFKHLKEIKTGLTAAEGVSLDIPLDRTIAKDHQVWVYVNGMFASASFSAGSAIVSITVPYPIETSDEIIVIYGT